MKYKPQIEQLERQHERRDQEIDVNVIDCDKQYANYIASIIVSRLVYIEKE